MQDQVYDHPGSPASGLLEQKTPRRSLAEQQRLHTASAVAQEALRADAARSGYYQKQIKRIYSRLVRPGSSVLDVGCGHGDLLEALKPSRGLGVDLSSAHIKRAKAGHPAFEFVVQDAHQLELDETFDYIILSDVILDVWDVQGIFHQLKKVLTGLTRFSI